MSIVTASADGAAWKSELVFLVFFRCANVLPQKKNILTICWFGLVSLFNGISTLFRLFNARAILLEQ